MIDLPTLLDFISMCDVYVTPYLNEAQMTSGTLSYSFGMGRAVVSTPYWHARELLADGRGVLVPFGDSATLRAQISDLLIDDTRRRVGLRVVAEHGVPTHVAHDAPGTQRVRRWAVREVVTDHLHADPDVLQPRIVQ